MIYIVIFAFLISVVLAMFMIPRILLLSYKKRLFDIPNARKIHKTPVPRLGGLSFLPVIIITFCFVLALSFLLTVPIESQWHSILLIQFLLFFVGLCIIYVVGIYDDLVGVSYRFKFFAQFLVGILIVTSGLWINNLGGIFGIHEISAWIGMPLTVLFIVYTINAINLIDGVDGLAAGLCCLSLIAISFICIATHQWIYALLNVICLGAVMVFFYYNVISKKTKKIFMGDAGSMSLGFLLSFTTIHFWQKLPWWNPFDNNSYFLVLSSLLIPLLDVVRVFLTRIRCHQNPFLPDRNHIHHKLIRTGMSLPWVMINILIMSVSFFLLNYLLLLFINTTLIIFLDIILWTLMHKIINYFIIRHSRIINRQLKL
ncbi:MAG: undecaprenyl/decaprenyl-phosphate alpha-N-acetylglucosaminyl 1-phosphate transferase [Muribaculaceae bacterium]|jgi:UDP-GlcNAc:undecaprenyl-phosphate GlcNAc-1-phosphate transferase|nr:undecaprenyl/decaprenyl-phosphate alpha-N-acetylglucosaminyl 1-phosphate transferase [Muribaculaceae bacterium]